MRPPLIDRFWAKVDKKGPDECWPWLGTTSGNKTKYGYIRDGKNRRVNRVAWELFCGPIPEGLVVRHKCDNGLCANPGHLELGTQKQNVADRYDRGRAFHHRGSAHKRARLTEDKVRQIRGLVGIMSHRKMAAHFDVCLTTIQHVIYRKRWLHVE